MADIIKNNSFKNDINYLKSLDLKSYFNAHQMLNAGTIAKNKILLIAVVIIIATISFLIGRTTAPSNTKVNAEISKEQKIEAPKPISTRNINKEFSFPILDQDNKEVSKMKYLIESANLQDEIIVRGQKATAVKGRVFLILNIKIINDANLGVQINTRDYVRLSANKSKELIAPSIHNDPLEVQPISTERTRIGFPINESDVKNLKLHVGEIQGSKTTIDLQFK